MRNLTIMSILLLLVAVAACSGTPAANYPYAKEPNPTKQEYVIGVSDSLSIRVWKNPELNTDIQVRPDGTITMPLIGEITAAGKTPTQLRQDVQERLGQFIKEEGAVVTIAVTDVNSYSVTVSGNVAQPGVFASKSYLTVLNAIALAGGPNRFAAPEEVIIIRKNPKGGVRRIPVNYTLITEGEAPEQNLVLMRDDIVHVP